MKHNSFSLIPLEKENDLNKILRQQKKSGDLVYILYTSLWDDTSRTLVEKLQNKYGTTSHSGARPLYVVNSFTMPHSFVIFKTTKVPHLVVLGRKPGLSHDYLPHIYEALHM